MPDPASLAHLVIGAAMQVQNTLGSHHAEVVYHRAMIEVLTAKGLQVADRPTLVVRLNNKPLAEYIPDSIVHCQEQTLILEYKADGRISLADIRQVQAYLSACNGPASGLILNFGGPRLTWQKVQPQRFQPLAPARRRGEPL
jgi:GxxExxY protein